MAMRTESGSTYLNTTTKECLEHFKGCNQLNCAATRGISRNAKREKRAKKREQHLINLQSRAR